MPTNFVYDNIALPATKSDAFPVTDATRQWAAGDGNACFTALDDIRTLLEHRTFNVAAYGAVGDGVTNDAPAITLAIAAAQTAQLSGQIYGAYVEFPKGIFLCNTAISIPNGVGLRGAGPTASVIKAAASFSAPALIQNTAQDGSQEFAFIEGLQIQGNQGGGAVCSVAVVNLVSLFVNSFVRDVVIIDGSNVGLRIAAAAAMGPIYVENVWVANCNGHNVLCEEIVGNTGACAGLCFVNLTTEHQGSGKSALYLKGLGSSAQWSFFNTHIEEGQSLAVSQNAITIDGVSNVMFDGLQLLTGNAAAMTEGVLITNVVQNVNICLRHVNNANLMNPVIRDNKNSVTVGAVNVPWYNTADWTFRGAPSFTPHSTAGSKSLVAKNSSGTDRAWFDDLGRLTGNSNTASGLDIVGDDTNNRPLVLVPSVLSGQNNIYGWYFPVGDGGALRERYITGGLDVRRIGTDATQFFYAGLTCQAAVLCQSTLRVNGNIGFYNTAPAAKPTVTGSRGGNAALASLLTALAGLGLVTDSSSA